MLSGSILQSFNFFNSKQSFESLIKTFTEQFKMRILRFSMDIMKLSSYLIVNPIMAYSYGLLFNSVMVVQTSDSMTTFTSSLVPDACLSLCPDKVNLRFTLAVTNHFLCFTLVCSFLLENNLSQYLFFIFNIAKIHVYVRDERFSETSPPISSNDPSIQDAVVNRCTLLTFKVKCK